jgi:hypothetical protein
MPDPSIHYLQGERLACGDTQSAFASPRLEAVTCPHCLKRQQQWPEAELLAAVREAANAYSYLCYHTYRSDRSEPGWFDVALAKPGRPLILAELKTRHGKLTMAQSAWYTAVAHATGVNCYVWRPADLPLITHLLRGGGGAPDGPY